MSLIPRKLREGIDEMRDSEPGCRFQDRYHRKQESGRSAFRRWLYLGGGTIIVLAGIFFLPAPGPGFLIIFLGGGLVAQESLAAARALDWVEVRVRKVMSWGKRTWKRASMPLRVLIVILAIAVGGAAAYGAWWMLFGR